MRRLVAVALLLLVACGRAGGATFEPVRDRQVRAVATTGMIGDLVRNIGGDEVELEVLMGPGIDPHVYRASERDVISIGEADIVFYNGLHLEAAMAEVLERTRLVRTVAVAEGDEEGLLRPPEFDDQYDPHVWFDVTRWITAGETVLDGLTKLAPDRAELFEENAERYLAELAELDRWVREHVQAVPPRQRVIVTAHDAFNYFGQAYGFEVVGLQGISTATEAGTSDVEDLVDLIVQREIPAVFIESSVPRRAVEAVQAAVRARGAEVEIGGELFSDALGTGGTPEGTYIGMVRHNVETIVEALS